MSNSSSTNSTSNASSDSSAPSPPASRPPPPSNSTSASSNSTEPLTPPKSSPPPPATPPPSTPPPPKPSSSPPPAEESTPSSTAPPSPEEATPSSDAPPPPEEGTSSSNASSSSPEEAKTSAPPPPPTPVASPSPPSPAVLNPMPSGSASSTPTTTPPPKDSQITITLPGGNVPKNPSSSSSSLDSVRNSPKQFPSSSSSSTSSSSDSSSSSSSSSSSFSPSTLGPSKGSSSSTAGLIAGVAIGGVVIVLIVAFFVMMKRKKRRRLDAIDYRPPTSISIDRNYYSQMADSTATDSYNLSQGQSSSSGVIGNSRYGYHSGPMDPNVPAGSKSWFTYAELAEVTEGFSQENMIGEGGFGRVYKGTLVDGKKVAVKQLKAGSGQGEREFMAEVEIISRVHHRHLVSLVGYCIAEHHRLLVYEFLSNNTLEHHLHGQNSLNWSNRMKIAIGSAKGLAYLHEDCHPKIIHRDIKSANILLEDSFEPQVADFGLAKLSNDTHTHVSTRVMGTFGYMAPEYASSGKLTDRSDVFSFGVVLLEIITGRKPVDSTRPLGDESLVEWARPLLVQALETGNCEELVDPRLEGDYNKAEMSIVIEAAAACVRHSASKRPRMVQVVRALDCQNDMQDLSNGVKYGQSRAFSSGQYSADLRQFHRMAFSDGESGSYDDSSEYDRRSTATFSGEQRSREHKPPGAWRPPQHSPGPSESDSQSMFQSRNSTDYARLGLP